jgi:plasmid maintenance system antidote protein VapI
MAQRGMRSKDLAKTLGMTQSSISLVLARESSPGGLVKKLAEVFGMKASEFVALGED